jgi:two-component system, chemotaxis family, protein-glutamate methylesterase/glutaminase
MPTCFPQSAPPELVVIGASRGGLRALSVILEGLPEDFPLPVAVVLHRVADDDHHLDRLLQQHSALPVAEAEDKTPLLPGRIYLAPPDYHLLIDAEGLALSNDEPVQYSRPSIDVLFESAADILGGRVIGVLLTGANADGAAGLLRLRQRGGLTLVQNPAQAEAPEMPTAAIAAAAATKILKLEDIAPFLRQAAGRPEP